MGAAGNADGKVDEGACQQGEDTADKGCAGELQDGAYNDTVVYLTSLRGAKPGAREVQYQADDEYEKPGQTDGEDLDERRGHQHRKPAVSPSPSVRDEVESNEYRGQSGRNDMPTRLTSASENMTTIAP